MNGRETEVPAHNLGKEQVMGQVRVGWGVWKNCSREGRFKWEMELTMPNSEYHLLLQMPILPAAAL